MDPITDYERDTLLHKYTSFHSQQNKTAMTLAYLFAVGYFFAFTILDLLLAFSNIPCYDLPLAPLITLKLWVLITGILGVFIIISSIIFGVIFTITNRVLIIIFSVIPQFVMLAWLIYGHVIFWVYYYPYPSCQNSLLIYMAVHLILGVIVIVMSLYFDYCS